MDQQPECEIPEAELLSLARGGSLDAFERIVVLHERRILALALRLTGNAEDAQDAAQEAFIRLHRQLGRIDSGRSVGPWLYTVTVNACRDIGRRRQRSRLVPMDQLPAGAPDSSGNPECLYSDRERESELQAGLRSLPERERAALLLREMEGLSTEEVARALGSTEGTVRSQICKARVKLRRFLKRGMEGKR